MIALVVAIFSRRVQVWAWTLVADLVADVTTYAFKELFGRPRPTVPALVHRPHDPSFPSGHAATSFACATVIAAAAPRLRIPLYVLAALIAVSRVYVGAHWPADVLAGAVYGVVLGVVLVRSLPPLAGALLRSLQARRRG